MASRMYSKGKTVPPRAPKPNSDSIQSQQTPLGYQFKKLINSQERKFRVMNIHCDQMQKSLEILENTISYLQQKIHVFMQSKGADSLQNLKDQQNTFIIQELNIKIKKQQRREVDLLEQSKKVKMENTRLKEDLQKSEVNLKEKAKKDEVQRKKLKEELKQKKDLIAELNMKIHALNNEQSKNISTFNPSITLPPKYPSQSDRMSQKQFTDLESKLKQIELLMSQQIQDLKQRNELLEQNLKKVNQEKERSDTKYNGVVYQLQIRLKQYKKLNKQLQDSYNALLAKSSENQIALHQQIMTLKKSVNDEKKVHKGLKKDIQNGIHQVVKILLPKSLIFQSTKLQQQLRQIAKQVQKFHKRALQSLKVMHKDQVQRLKQQIDAKERCLQAQIMTRRKTEKSFSNASQVMSQGSANQNNLNNSFNRSSEKADFSQQDKIKVKFQSLQRQLKQKQARIYEIQQQMDQQFSQSTQKILSMQQQFLSKNNECRRKDQIIRDLNIEIDDLKKKLQMSQKLKQDIKVQYDINKNNLQSAWKQKNSKVENSSLGYKTALKQSEQRQQQMTSKYNKLKAKIDKIQNETADSIKSKTERIDQLTKKNQQLMIQIKLAKEKLKLQQSFKASSSELQNVSPRKSGLSTPVNKDLIEQIQMERDRILQEYQTKKKELNNVENEKKILSKKVKTLQQDLQQQKAASAKIKAKYQTSKAQFETIKIQLKAKLETSEKEHQSSFVKLKKQYQKISNALKSSEKNLQRKRKDYEQAVKSRQKYKKEAQTFKGQTDKFSNKLNEIEHKNQNSLKQQEQIIKNKDLKISQQNIQINELMKILDYRNNLDQSSLRESRRQSVKQQHVPKKLIAPQVAQIGVNTDFQRQYMNMSKLKKTPKRLTSKCQDILDACEGDQTVKIQAKQQQKEQITPITLNNDNLFINLGNQRLETDQNFEICEEGQQINIGRTQQNLKIKEIFNRLRIQIEKIFNGEDPSMSILKILPFQLEDDYGEFVTYVRQKMEQMRNMNDISFIGVVIGDQPDVSQTSLDLPELMRYGSQDTYKRTIFQKEQIINSLMAQKTEQQNTINQLTMQKEETEQQNENRFMNQCNIYKRQIKQHKKMLDILQMNYQSMKNLLKNICEIWVSEDDNEEDLRDNLELYAKVAKLADKERSRMNFYIMKYREIKGIQ